MPAQATKRLQRKKVTLAHAASTAVPHDEKGPRWQAITGPVTYYIAEDIIPVYTGKGIIRRCKRWDRIYFLEIERNQGLNRKLSIRLEK